MLETQSPMDALNSIRRTRSDARTSKRSIKRGKLSKTILISRYFILPARLFAFFRHFQYILSVVLNYAESRFAAASPRKLENELNSEEWP